MFKLNLKKTRTTPEEIRLKRPLEEGCWERGVTFFMGGAVFT